MPTRGSPAPPPGPPNLLMDGDRARQVVEGLIQDAHRLLGVTQLSQADFEQYEADYRRWVTKVTETLTRMWDQRRYADSFYMRGHYLGAVRTTYDRLSDRFSRLHESLRNQIHFLESHVDTIDIAASSPTARRAPLSQESDSTPARVVVHGTIGSLSIGNQVRDITTTVQAVSGATAGDVQRLTTALAEAFAAAVEVPEEERGDVLEQVKFVAGAAANPGKHPRAVLSPIIDRIGLIAKGSSAVHDIYQQWQPLVAGLLEHHHP